MDKELLHTRAVREILSLIISGDYPEGKRLPAERVLCERFGISRGTLRKALADLDKMGAIAVKPQSGAYVQRFTKTRLPKKVLPKNFKGVSLEDIIVARRAIEIASIELAAETITDQELKALRDSTVQMESEVNNLPMYLALDMAFHEQIVKASKNEVLITAFEAIAEYHRYMAALGAKVIAISDIHGGILDEKGLDIQQLMDHYKSTGYLKGFTKASSVTNEEILTCHCDILIPAATQSQITAENAPKIQAKLIAEGANAPTTPQADEILNDRGVFIIPDILCNAGGVFVSYLEYTQETQREQMTLEQVQDRLQDRMFNRFTDVYHYHKENQVSMRDAAMDMAVKRVIDAVDARGFLP